MKIQGLSGSKRIDGMRLQPVNRKKGGSPFGLVLNQPTGGMDFGNSGLRDSMHL
jgi:hypothetical protein